MAGATARKENPENELRAEIRDVKKTQQREQAEIFDLEKERRKRNPIVTKEGLQKAAGNVGSATLSGIKGIFGIGRAIVQPVMVTDIGAIIVFFLAATLVAAEWIFSIGSNADILTFSRGIWGTIFLFDMVMIGFIASTSKRTPWNVFRECQSFLAIKLIFVPLIFSNSYVIEALQAMDQGYYRFGVKIIYVIFSTYWLSLIWIAKYVGKYIDTFLVYAVDIFMFIMIVSEVYLLSQTLVALDVQSPLQQSRLARDAIVAIVEDISEVTKSFMDSTFYCPAEGRIGEIEECVLEKKIARNPERYAPQIRGEVDQDIREFVKVKLEAPSLRQSRFLLSEQVEISASLEVDAPEEVPSITIENECRFERGTQIIPAEVRPQRISNIRTISEEIVCFKAASDIVDQRIVAANPTYVGIISSRISGITTKGKITNLFMNKQTLDNELTGYARDRNMINANRNDLMKTNPKYEASVRATYPSGRVESRSSPGLAIPILSTSDQLIIGLDNERNEILLKAGIQNQEDGKIISIQSFSITLPEGFNVKEGECVKFTEIKTQQGNSRLALKQTGIQELNSRLNEIDKSEGTIVGNCRLLVTNQALLTTTSSPEPKNFIAEVIYDYKKDLRTTVTIGETPV